MSSSDPSDIPSITKWRGVICSSITRLANRLSVLGSKPPNQYTLKAAQQTLQILNDLNAEFKILQFDIIDLIEDDKTLDKNRKFLIPWKNKLMILRSTSMIIHHCTAVKETSKDDLFIVMRKLSAVKGNSNSVD